MQATERAQSTQVSARLVGLLAVLVLMPFPLIVHDFTHRNLSYDYLTIVFPVDIALLVLLIAAAPPILHDLRRRQIQAGWGGWLALSIVMVAAFAVHPSSRGLHTLFELFAVVAIAHTVTHTLAHTEEPAERNLVLGTLAAVAVMETAWAMAQRVHGGAIGLGALGESAHPLLEFAPHVLAPQGSMVHIYVLAGLGLVAASLLGVATLDENRPQSWAVLVALAIAPVGFTYSRAALLGLGLLVAGFGLAALPTWRPLDGAARRKALLVAGALVIGAAVPALIWSNGWRSRAQQTTASTSAADITTDRTHLMHEAATLIRADPIFGVGPGRYVLALKAHYGTEPDRRVGVFKPVHDVPMLAAAEGGLLAGAVVVALLVALAWRALRDGPVALAVFGGLLPFVLLDHFPYSFPQGLVLTGLWLGTLDALAARTQHARPAA